MSENCSQDKTKSPAEYRPEVPSTTANKIEELSGKDDTLWTKFKEIDAKYNINVVSLKKIKWFFSICKSNKALTWSTLSPIYLIAAFLMIPLGEIITAYVPVEYPINPIILGLFTILLFTGFMTHEGFVAQYLAAKGHNINNAKKIFWHQ